jgi:hypothetical protein
MGLPAETETCADARRERRSRRRIVMRYRRRMLK